MSVWYEPGLSRNSSSVATYSGSAAIRSDDGMLYPVSASATLNDATRAFPTLYAFQQGDRPMQFGGPQTSIRKEPRVSYMRVSSVIGDDISCQKRVFVAMLIERCVYMPESIALM
jgi:hypothetical protein